MSLVLWRAHWNWSRIEQKNDQCTQGRIKAGADGAAAPGPPTKIGLSITTYYEQLSDFFINQLFYFKVEYELPIFIGLIYPV